MSESDTTEVCCKLISRCSVDYAAHRALFNALRLACWSEDCVARRALSNILRLAKLVSLSSALLPLSPALSSTATWLCLSSTFHTWILHTHAHCEGRTTYINMDASSAN